MFIKTGSETRQLLRYFTGYHSRPLIFLLIVTFCKLEDIVYTKVHLHSKNSPNSNMHKYLKPRWHVVHRYKLQCLLTLCFQNWTTELQGKIGILTQICLSQVSHSYDFYREWVAWTFFTLQENDKVITCININLFMLHKTCPPINACCNFQSHAAKFED